MLEPTVLPPNRPIRLSNLTCVYCGVELKEGEGAPGNTREHVIGRRFVPRGTLDGEWNLIVRACQSCNTRKSDLEDDLSAILMQPDAWGRFASDDARLREAGSRKGAHSVSRTTRKPVSASWLELQIRQGDGPSPLAHSFIAPPQPDSERAQQLARLQIGAFFYLITYDETLRKGRFWPGCFGVVGEALRADWGNVRLRAFMARTGSWDPRFLGNGAAGFFRVVIRRCPDSAPLWAWAIEWNASYRLAGFFGEETLVRAEATELPPLSSDIVARTPNSWTWRREVHLPPAEDTLFLGEVT